MIDRGKSMGPHGGNRPPSMVLAAEQPRQDPIAAVPIDLPLAQGVSKQEMASLAESVADHAGRDR